jgi:hypothetical protein
MALANQSEPNLFSFSHLASFRRMLRGFVWSSGAFGLRPWPLSFGGLVIVLFHSLLKLCITHFRAVKVTSLNGSGMHPGEAKARPMDEPEAFRAEAHKRPLGLCAERVVQITNHRVELFSAEHLAAGFLDFDTRSNEGQDAGGDLCGDVHGLLSVGVNVL